MLEEDSDNNESDEETIFEDQPSVSSISNIPSDKENNMYCPSDVSSSSDEDEESPLNTAVQFSRNDKTCTSQLSARLVRTNQSNIVRVKPEVNTAL